MKVILTGATGYIGSSVLSSLLQNGHTVGAVVRSRAAAAGVTSAGASALLGELTDTPWLTEQLRFADGAIHTAAPAANAEDLDRAVARSVITAFSGTRKPYLHTGGIWSYGNNLEITEESPRDAPALVAWRGEIEADVLHADVRSSVVEPGVVYGKHGGLLALLAAGPRTADGALELIGDGSQHWATVHVDDLARLYRLVLESDSYAGRVIGASGVRVTVAELAQAIEPENGVVASHTSASRDRLGPEFADALLLDQHAYAAKARSWGWLPRGASAVDVLLGVSRRNRPHTRRSLYQAGADRPDGAVPIPSTTMELLCETRGGYSEIAWK